MKKKITIIALLLSVTSAFCQWNHVIDIYHPIRDKQDIVRVWKPASATKIKGFYLSGGIGNAKSFAESWSLRSHLQASEMGIVYIRTNYLGMSVFDHERDSAFFWHILDTVSHVTGIKEFKHAPWVVFGHSTDGLMAQNISLWKPERTLGILYYKSGNLGNPNNMYEPYKTLDRMDKIPFLAINGRYEQFGPNGPFPGCSSPYPDSCYREVQWWSMRDTLMQLRERGYRVSMAVDHYGNADHDSKTYHSFDLMGAFVEAASKNQLSSEYPTNAPIPIKRINEEDGILGDSALTYLMDVGYFYFPTEAPYYFFQTEDVNHKFWMPDRVFTDEWVEFHSGNDYNVPATPSNLSLTQSPGTINLEWTINTPEGLEYIIQRKTETDNFVNIDSIAAGSNSYSDTKITSNTNYKYRIFSYNTDGISDYSNEVSALSTTIISKNNDEIKIYQKENFITIISGNVIKELSLFDITGKIILKSNPVTKSAEINISGINNGIYLLNITTNTEEKTKKINIFK